MASIFFMMQREPRHCAITPPDGSKEYGLAELRLWRQEGLRVALGSASARGSEAASTARLTGLERERPADSAGAAKVTLKH
jgi:hypothetical protein